MCINCTYAEVVYYKCVCMLASYMCVHCAYVYHVCMFVLCICACMIYTHAVCMCVYMCIYAHPVYVLWIYACLHYMYIVCYTCMYRVCAPMLILCVYICIYLFMLLVHNWMHACTMCVCAYYTCMYYGSMYAHVICVYMYIYMLILCACVYHECMQACTMCAYTCMYHRCMYAHAICVSVQCVTEYHFWSHPFSLHPCDLEMINPVNASPTDISLSIQPQWPWHPGHVWEHGNAGRVHFPLDTAAMTGDWPDLGQSTVFTLGVEVTGRPSDPQLLSLFPEELASDLWPNSCSSFSLDSHENWGSLCIPVIVNGR